MRFKNSYVLEILDIPFNSSSGTENLAVDQCNIKCKTIAQMIYDASNTKRNILLFSGPNGNY